MVLVRAAAEKSQRVSFKRQCQSAARLQFKASVQLYVCDMQRVTSMHTRSLAQVGSARSVHQLSTCRVRLHFGQLETSP